MGLESMLCEAASVHGLLTTATACRHGFNRTQLDRLSQRGILEFLGSSLYRCIGSPDTWHQRVMIGVLATGGAALASHRCAAAVWGLEKGRSVEVLVPKGTGARTDLARVHDTRHMRGIDVDIRSGVPTTSIERTLVDLAGVLPLGQLARHLDKAHSDGLTTFERVHQRMCSMPTRGRRGVPILRMLLEERIGTFAEDDNPFESLMAEMLDSSDLPTAERQVLVEANQRRYYLDFAFCEYMVAIECDGLLGHGSASAQAMDLTRQNDILEQGWTLRRFTWSDVRTQPDAVLDRIRRALLANGWEPDPHQRTVR